jgi:hypothetical protein
LAVGNPWLYGWKSKPKVISLRSAVEWNLKEIVEFP